MRCIIKCVCFCVFRYRQNAVHSFSIIKYVLVAGFNVSTPLGNLSENAYYSKHTHTHVPSILVGGEKKCGRNCDYEKKQGT